MTRKDFQLIADVMAETRPARCSDPRAYALWCAVMKGLANRLADTNPRFEA